MNDEEHDRINEMEDSFRREMEREREVARTTTWDRVRYAIIEELAEALSVRRTLMRASHGRVLPVGDLLSDRWEKARYLGWGEGSSVYDSCVVIGDVKVGAHTWVGPFTVLDGSGGGLEIGDHCSISAGVQIYTHDSVVWALSGGVEPLVRAPTLIGSRCYLGPHAVVAKGVTIGDGCVVGAHSVVMNDLEPGTRAFGVPAKVRGT